VRRAKKALSRGSLRGNNSMIRIDIATARQILEQNQAQKQLIHSLMSENQQLQEMKRQKVLLITRIPLFFSFLIH
jgi:hypothetical protein